MQKKYRLKGRKTFNYLLNKGTSVPAKDLVLIYAPSKYSIKAGFIVSKKIGNAVTRNRTRRRLKEAFRSLIPDLQDNINYVIIARAGIEELDFKEIKEALIGVLKRAGLLNKEN